MHVYVPTYYMSWVGWEILAQSQDARLFIVTKGLANADSFALLCFYLTILLEKLDSP